MSPSVSGGSTSSTFETPSKLTPNDGIPGATGAANDEVATDVPLAAVLPPVLVGARRRAEERIASPAVEMDYERARIAMMSR